MSAPAPALGVPAHSPPQSRRQSLDMPISHDFASHALSRDTTRMSAYPAGEPMSVEHTRAPVLDMHHHPIGPADPSAPAFYGARRSKQAQVTGLGRAMPTAEELELKARLKQYKAAIRNGTATPSAPHEDYTAMHALDSISDPNLKIMLGEILSAIHGQGHGSRTAIHTPALSRVTTAHVDDKALVRVPTIADLPLDESDVDSYPNPIAKWREYIREPAAEFLGTAMILAFGNGVNQQFFLSADTAISSLLRGTYLSVSFGWGIGVMVGVYVAGGISGAHLNPAVTLSLAVFRKFSWKKVPGYMLAQVLGAMTGSGITHLLYERAIDIFEGGQRTMATAGLATTFPLDYMSPTASFFQEFWDTAILLFVILAIGDSNNAPPPDGIAPIVLLFLIVGIGACMGSQTAYAINPARDLGPRLMLWCSGYGTEIWTAYNWYWIWCPILAPLLGGLAGCLVYDIFLYRGAESPINRPWNWRWSKNARSANAYPQQGSALASSPSRSGNEKLPALHEESPSEIQQAYKSV